VTIKIVLGNLYSSPPSLLYCYLHFLAGFMPAFFIYLDKRRGDPYCRDMALTKRHRLFTQVLLGITLLFAVGIGVGIGLMVSGTKNLRMRNVLGEYQPALPSQIVDRDGRLITEIFSEEKRDIVTVREVPKHLIFALITREDENFFFHRGFSFRGVARAALHLIIGEYSGGGSTISQQVAGRHFADRTDISLRRKLRELWYSFQLEKSFTKDQILDLYMNEEYFGHNTYGVETASQFYFSHSAKELTPAEAALLVIQLSSPVKYSPIKNPNNAKTMQKDVLDRMVRARYLEKETADVSFSEYWSNYDFTRSNISSAYFENQSRAPYFSEYVRLQLEEMLYGSLDINRDGFIIHTTLDLDFQKAADEMMKEGIHTVNATYRANSDRRMRYVDEQFVPIVDMLSLVFNIQDIRVAGAQKMKEAKEDFYKYLSPTIDIVSLLLGSEDIKFLANMAQSKQEQENKRNIVEGALITIENDTGHILSMVGGSDFKAKQYNRAVQAKVQPGSAFKPLYYSAAISSKEFTPATMIYDAPIVLWNQDGSYYKPLNYMGEWSGPVLLRQALANSMNVPSIQILDAIGFDAAINRASRLLGISDPVQISQTFPRNYPLALGIISVAPIQMAKAFSTMANLGKEVEPIAIVYVEDRNGNIILEPEKELRSMQKRRGGDLQIMPPPDAYIMIDMLQTTVESGTLAGRRRLVGGFDGMPMAGKTGTTQNWSDAWTVGFSPYVTTAVWFGFDLPGNSLGVNQTGATAAGPVWARYMKEIHKQYPVKEFLKPENGLTEVTVCSVSGKLPTDYCSEGTHKEIFLEGTEPWETCELHEFRNKQERKLLDKLQRSILSENISSDTFELPSLEDSILEGLDFTEEWRNTLDDTGAENPLLD
jgi:penicillin-binding protein 1A